MSIPTANVIITQKKEPLNKFLEKMASGESIPSLLSELSGPGVDQLLFSNYNNPNFISFEHATIKGDVETKLEFIDPKNEFEERFLATSSIYDEVLEQFREQQRFGTTRDLTSENLQEGLQQKIFYIAYGIGDNIDSWSGVQRMQLTGASLDVTKSRRISLRFASLPRALAKDRRVGLFGDPIDLNTMGVEFDCDGYSDRIDFFNNFKYGRRAYGRGLVGPTVDLHELITDTLRDYLKKATNGANVVVLLPDLNKLLSKNFDSYKADNTNSLTNPTDSLKIALNSILSDINIFLDGSQPDRRGIATITAATEEKVRAEGDPTNLLEHHYKTTLYRSRLSSYKEEGIPDLEKPLFDVMIGINSKSKNQYKINPVLFSEADTTVTDFWSEKDDKFTFGLYDADFFGGGWNKNKPTVVFGDLTLITNLLYGQKQRPLDIPIHKTTKEELDDSYISEFNELFEPNNILTPFGKVSDVPDEFGYTDELFTPDQLKTIKERKIPVFKYNTQNPNITDLIYKDEAIYYTLLNNSFALNVNRIADTAADGGVPLRLSNKPIVSREALDASIIASKIAAFGPVLSNQEIVNEIFDKIDPVLRSEVMAPVYPDNNEGKNTDIRNYVSEIDNIIDENLDFLNIKLDSDRETDPKTIIQNFIDNIAQVTKEITIKTLPFFNISTRGLALQSPCIVFYQDAPILAQQRQPRTGFNNFLTGLYALQGFRHKIGKKVESEFLLVKVDTRIPKAKDIKLEEGKENKTVPANKTRIIK